MKGIGRGQGGGQGRGPGRGQGQGRGGGRGRGGGYGLGPDGDCYCPNCHHREPHQLGVPCYNRKCPQCGTLMTRA